MLRRSCSRALSLCLMLALPAAAGAAELFRWVTPDGRVVIGTSPPPGVHAEIWRPDQPAPATPPAAPTPAAPTPGAAAPAPKGLTPLQAERAAECERQKQARENLTGPILTRMRIHQLEAKIRDLEDSPIASQAVECIRGAYGRATDCEATSFNRDQELESAQKELEKEQAKLEELEERARRLASEPDEHCDSEPAAPAP